MLFKDKFKRRSAYGLLYGTLKLNLEKNMIFFAVQECSRFITEKKFDLFTYIEILSILDVLEKNQNLLFEEKLIVWNDIILPILVGRKWQSFPTNILLYVFKYLVKQGCYNMEFT